MGLPNSVSSWQKNIYLPAKLTVIFFRIIKINQIRPFVLVHVVASRSSGSQIILHLQLSNLHVVLPLSRHAPSADMMPFRTYSWPLGKTPISNLFFEYFLHHLPLEKEMTTHTSILAWRIPCKEEPSGLQSTGSQTVGHD